MGLGLRHVSVVVKLLRAAKAFHTRALPRAPRCESSGSAARGAAGGNSSRRCNPVGEILWEGRGNPGNANPRIRFSDISGCEHCCSKSSSPSLKIFCGTACHLGCARKPSLLPTTKKASSQAPGGSLSHWSESDLRSWPFGRQGFDHCAPDLAAGSRAPTWRVADGCGFTGYATRTCTNTDASAKVHPFVAKPSADSTCARGHKAKNVQRVPI